LKKQPKFPHGESYALILARQWFGLRLGRFFLQTPPVTLVANEKFRFVSVTAAQNSNAK
jgi:hypothetical protein